MKIRVIISLFAAALLLGCFKDVSYNTTLIIKPLIQKASGDPSTPLMQATAHAFIADTTLWGVASYADAVAGVLTSKSNPSEKMQTPAATASAYELEGAEGWLQMAVSNASLMLMVIDTENEIYGYTQHELGENLPKQYVSVVFKPWKEGKAYKDGVWSFYRESYTPPPTVEFNIRPTVQTTEGAEEAAPTNFKTYAFPVELSAWHIASYQDAVDGIITSTSDPEQTHTNPPFTGYSRDEIYWMTVSSPSLMVVAVDRTNRLYAYRQQQVDLLAAPITVPIVFRPWKGLYIYEEQGWQVVNEQLKPDPDPETPSTPQSAKETPQ